MVEFMTMLRLILCLVLLGGCVPVPMDHPDYDLPPRRTMEGPYESLDPGANSLESLHFGVRAYGSAATQRIADLAEASYNRIMLDTNLYSFKPSGLYQLIVYANEDEYHKKTGQPAWSAGVTVGNAIYTYESPRLAGVIAHEMTHLIFFEFMGKVAQEQRWFNEGLAVYEEEQALGRGRGELFAGMAAQLRQVPLPMESMLRLTPATEKEYTVNLWYAQAYSMVGYMIDRGSRIGFSQFLQALKDGHNYDQALLRGFPNLWRTLEDFHRDWRLSLN